MESLSLKFYKEGLRFSLLISSAIMENEVSPSKSLPLKIKEEIRIKGKNKRKLISPQFCNLTRKFRLRFSELENVSYHVNFRPIVIKLHDKKIYMILPMNPDAIIWGSLLSSSCSCRDIDIAEWAAQNLILLDPHDTSAHVMMAKVYAASRHFEKQPGRILIEVNGVVHVFVVGGNWHFHDGRSLEEWDLLAIN